ncbi:tetraacyldisaccharide 4'-kinase [Gemmatimonas sp.]|uniref:tetraacyldisaccharide 4'-kinase n=1 Tax=Gemmatimonas sp. TaxID=1962908 RepID=UPI00286A50CE|nr:tetraacyldisaccharide 4'-kinase [Gemmatimonas sp.]
MSLGTGRRAFISYVWNSDAVGARLVRGAVTPLNWLFGAIVARRNAGFDARVREGAMPVAALPAMSVGNLTVGGTGKTPVASWFVSRLKAGGATPALVLRGYGDDEWRVHGLLTPGVPVVVAPERAVGLVIARSMQCDCAVLDDAFQHRQVSRVVDVVLVSADAWHESVRLLPGGPYREPLGSLNRASVAVITVKAAPTERVQAVRAAIRAAAPDVPIAQLRLAPDTIRLAATISGGPGGPRSLQHDLTWLRGRKLVLVSAIADPDAFRRQMEAAGAVVEHHAAYPDHHDFVARDLADIVARSHSSVEVLCTLKDAVKLVPLWPRAGAALWYVSQTVVVEQGAEILDQAVARVLAARRATTPTAG